MQADELEDRLIDFAVRVLKLSENLPKSDQGKYIAKQIMRSGSAWVNRASSASVPPHPPYTG